MIIEFGYICITLLEWLLKLLLVLYNNVFLTLRRIETKIVDGTQSILKSFGLFQYGVLIEIGIFVLSIVHVYRLDLVWGRHHGVIKLRIHKIYFIYSLYF